MKKPFYKRWSTYLYAFIAIILLGFILPDSQEDAEAVEPETEVPAEEVADVELSAEDRVADVIKREKAKRVKITDVSVNNGVVLPYLQYDATGSVDSAVRVITKYSDAFAEELAKDASITEVTVFWELPGIMKADAGNVAKFNYLREGDKLVLADVWLVPALDK